jgi:hypothetical protein
VGAQYHRQVTLTTALFCEIGVERFERELRELPSGVHHAALNSLRDRAQESGVEYVLYTRI